MAVDGDTLLGRAQVAMFPTTISVTPDGELAFVANSDFYGDHPRTNVVSIVYTPTMTLLTNLAACDMPHGVKVNHAGTRVYVSCMNSDEILEVDRQTLAITRRHRTGVGVMPPMPMTHGGAYSPDNRFAFVSQESKGVDPGAVDVIDLSTHRHVATIPVPLQPTGITMLRLR